MLHRVISQYLDRPDVRSTIGVDPSITSNFSSCNYEVNAAFHAADDSMFPTQYYIAALLERGIRALIYVGANDWICNWVRVISAWFPITAYKTVLHAGRE